MAENDKTPGKGNRPELAHAVRYTIFLLAVVEFVLFITVLAIAFVSAALLDIYFILFVILFEAVIMPMVLRKRWFNFLPGEKKFEKIVVFVWGNLTAIHICWLVVGIMINTLWGLIVLLVISVVVSAFVFAIYIFLCSTKAVSEETETAAIKADKIRFGLICVISLLSLMSLIVVVILSGQAFFGRDSANELMKTALLYVTTAFISWIARKVKEEGDKTKKSVAGGEESKDEQLQGLVPPNTTELTVIKQGN